MESQWKSEESSVEDDTGVDDDRSFQRGSSEESWILHLREDEPAALRLVEPPLAAALAPVLCPLRGVGEYGLLGEDVLGEALRPHQARALVLLGDEEATLLGAMAAAFLLGDEARWWRELLRLLGGVHIVEVHRLPRPAEAPRRRVVHARGLVRRVERPEADALVAGADLRVEIARRVRADADIAEGVPSAARRHLLVGGVVARGARS